MARRAQIVGWGKCLPTTVMTNVELEQRVDSSDEWIRTRTGIVERRLAAPGETTFSLALRAALDAVEVADINPARIDMVLVATCTPDYGAFPSVASLVQHAIGATHAGAFDLNAACAGFAYGFAIASDMITSGSHRTVLLIGAETMSRILDWTDRSTCVLFGDGAGAVVLQASEALGGVLSTVLGSDGAGAHLLFVPGDGSDVPPAEAAGTGRRRYVKMDGREVYRFAVNVTSRAAQEAVAKARLGLTDIDLFIPHQANIRII